MIFTNKMSVFKRTLLMLIATAIITFILMLLIIKQFSSISLQWHLPSFYLIVLFFVGVALVLSMTTIAFRSYLQPMHEMTEKALKIADGDYSVRFNSDIYDLEWQLLMRVFNQMAEEINHKIDELNVQNTILREKNDQIELYTRRLSDRMEIKSKRLQEYISIIDTYVIISQTDINGIITYASEAFAKVSGHTKSELIGSNHNIVRHPDMEDEVFENMWQMISSGKTWKGELKNLKSNGESYWVDTTISPNYENDVITGYTAIRFDITYQKRVEEMSITDSMTGIFNRRYYSQKITEELNRSRRNGFNFALMMIDVDNFKAYNDTYGHKAGDEVLEKVAIILKNFTSRSGEYAFRMGGEEFATLFINKTASEYFDLAQLIRSHIENLAIEHRLNDSKGVVSVSIGIKIVNPSDNIGEDEIYRQADICLYEAKRKGRNRVFM